MYRFRDFLPIDTFLGKVFTKIIGAEKESEEIVFVINNDEAYKMFHEQDCCETVSVEDVCGEISDLIGNPILQAEEVTQEKEESAAFEDHRTWTFYKLTTIKGCVTLRWLGTSNGYYSESVDIVKMTKEDCNEFQSK